MRNRNHPANVPSIAPDRVQLDAARALRAAAFFTGAHNGHRAIPTARARRDVGTAWQDGIEQARADIAAREVRYTTYRDAWAGNADTDKFWAREGH